uniref:Uncharacterized protein n=1 Tax=Amphimedon queenslandica TaxID=400682 RepID=A0A1X7TR36_AMPQE
MLCKTADKGVPQPSMGFLLLDCCLGEVYRTSGCAKQTWQAEEKSNDRKVSMEKAKDSQKRWYDKDARLRVFGTGDEILELLATS